MKQLSPFRAAKLALSATAAAAVLLLTACGGPAGVNGELREAASTKTAAKTMKVALITHSTQGDTFWDIVRKGAEAASAKDGIELLYSADPDGARQAQLVEQAVDQKVDGIIVSLSKPEAMESAVKEAVAAGIPVFSINSGENDWQRMGILAHFGQDDKVAGQVAGEKLRELGAKRVICVIHEQGNIGHEARCQGAAETSGASLERLYVNAADPANEASTITAKLQTDSAVDYVLTLGAPQAAIAAKSIKETHSSAQLATFDLNDAVIKMFERKQLSFAVDQQPYLQGYEAVDAVWLHHNNLNVLGGGRPVLTGPAIVTADQIAQLQKYVSKGTR